jgi:hypothetical protein
VKLHGGRDAGTAPLADGTESDAGLSNGWLLHG